MSEKPVRLIPPPEGYADWLTDLKGRIHSAQQRSTRAVNRELVLLYWQIGRDILDRQARQGWGAKVTERLAEDLRAAFPEMMGFSRANLMYMRAFAEAWPDAGIVQQAVGQLSEGLPRCNDTVQYYPETIDLLEYEIGKDLLKHIRLIPFIFHFKVNA